MSALGLTTTWPVEHVSAAVLDASGRRELVGPADHVYRLASIAKPIAAWAILVAVEEGIVALDQPIGQPGCTLRHLLSHAGGYPFDGHEPIGRPGARRVYSNTGIELAAGAVEVAAAMPFSEYLSEAVLRPLGMGSTELRGSPAHALWSTLTDLVAFTGELLSPQLLGAATVAEATAPVFPQLAGVVPGVGRFDPCPWGLGFELRGDKHPHWTGTRNSPSTFGHFGGAGTFMWVDPGVTDARGVVRPLACVALTDRSFDEWAAEALRAWPDLSDAVIDEATGDGVAG